MPLLLFVVAALLLRPGKDRWALRRDVIIVAPFRARVFAIILQEGCSIR